MALTKVPNSLLAGGGGGGGYTLGAEFDDTTSSGSILGTWSSIPAGWSELIVVLADGQTTITATQRFRLGNSSGWNAGISGRSQLHNSSANQAWASGYVYFNTAQANTTWQDGVARVTCVNPSAAAASRRYIVFGMGTRDGVASWYMTGMIFGDEVAEFDRIEMSASGGTFSSTTTGAVYYF